MSVHWKEIVPVDTYEVQFSGYLHNIDRKVLTMLYQPLIGAFAYSLYMTFWCDAEMKTPKEQTHQRLMNVTQFSLKDIIAARKKLEAIGLLKTYKRDKEDSRVYLYELQTPLSPDEFFNDGVLNIYLYNRLGKTKYCEMRDHFIQEETEMEEYVEMTSSFNDVFVSLHPSEMTAGTYSEIQEGSGGSLAERKPGNPLSITSEDFDFDLLISSISSFILPKEVITPSIRESILKLAYVYQMGPLEMSRQIQNAYHLHGELTAENLRKEVQKWYRIENNNQLPQMALRTQPQSLKSAAGREPVTEEEKVIKFFEEVSPFQLLELQSGTKPAEVDLNIVTYLMLEQKMTPGVVNVLIDYVLKTNDLKLTRSFVEKIASHWARKKVQTVQEAMALARSEQKKYKEWQERKNTNYKRNGTQKKSARLPDWLKDEEATAEKKEKNNNNNELEEQNQQWLENLLKEI
ncbi:DnaD domain protein [Fictibacillus sp. WQ 8-8]|uniref:replication initiation and membrane attachment family protein n=1 Tax=unclassified Fictibacillus TaxID=2644029 RepID=UPI0008F155BF|nr:MULTISPECIES: DnaD domain protein [unclassified Fictibacillus]MCQ6266536.1 DnaD domain protein [Fictibacillus sp. WQ 8-8]MED2971531.1 DnaD domain protein [Fictibacillus sp. B-59209]SFD59681.1 replicative DNA helicase loader DnaB [Bacillus sp. OV194]